LPPPVNATSTSGFFFFERKNGFVKKEIYHQLHHFSFFEDTVDKRSEDKKQENNAW